MILLDTHVLVWLDEGSPRLGRKSREMIDEGLNDEELAVSAISFWEVAMLVRKQRLSLLTPVSKWTQDLLHQGLIERPVNSEIGITAAELPDYHGDPADRLIMATAISNSATLVTADKNILNWNGNLQRHNAIT